ncbi:hypothetical protein QTP88_004206 [Uroleucon formosanum]
MSKNYFDDYRWQQFQAIGLTNNFRTSTEIGKFLKRFFGLSFLPPEMVGDVFVFELTAMTPTDLLHDGIPVARNVKNLKNMHRKYELCEYYSVFASNS